MRPGTGKPNAKLTGRKRRLLPVRWSAGLCVPLVQPGIALPPVLCPCLFAELLDHTQFVRRRHSMKGLQEVKLFTNLVFRAFPAPFQGVTLHFDSGKLRGRL